MKNDLCHNTRSFNTQQLKRRDFKTKKYDRFSILSKRLPDWNLLQNALKTNFKKLKRSEIKTLVTNHFLDKYQKVIVKNNYKKSKKLQMKSTPYTSILLHCLLSFPMSFLSLSLSVFLFLSPSSFLFLLPFLLSSSTQLDLILKAVS